MLYLNTAFSAKQLCWVSKTTVLGERRYTFNYICTVYMYGKQLYYHIPNGDLVRVSGTSSVDRQCRKRQTDCKMNLFFSKVLYASLCLCDIYTEVVQQPSDEDRSVADC